MRFLLLSVWLFGICGHAAAQQNCSEIDQFIQDGKVPSFALLDNVSCGKSLTASNRISYHCAWEFDFRQSASEAYFKKISEVVSACAKRDETNEQSRVNHPDSYDQLNFERSGETISISLKDKAALQKTYVFLRSASQ